MAVVDMISFGSVYLELVFGHVPALPRPGQEIFAEEFAISCGGAVTSATAAARTGVRAGVCTRLGDDLGGRVVTEHCEREGIDLSASVRVPRPATGITMVLNYDGDRSFVTHLPPIPATEPSERARWIEVLRSRQPAWAYVHAGPGMTGFLRAAREQGTKVLLDVSLNEIGQDAHGCHRLHPARGRIHAQPVRATPADRRQLAGRGARDGQPLGHPGGRQDGG